jgi:hypothetical protein
MEKKTKMENQTKKNRRKKQQQFILQFEWEYLQSTEG